MSNLAVIVGLDNSPSATAALQWAADFCRRTASPLKAVHVTASNQGLPYLWSPGFANIPTLPNPMMEESLRTDIRRLFDSINPEPAWSLLFCSGSPGSVLVERAQQAQLLVIGTREHAGINRLISGSVSHYCLSHSTCPIATIPSQPSKPTLNREEVAATEAGHRS